MIKDVNSILYLDISEIKNLNIESLSPAFYVYIKMNM